MTAKIRIRNEDGKEFEGEATSVKFLKDNREEVEGHGGRWGRSADDISRWGRSEDEGEEVEGHGPMFKLSTDDPTVVAALGKAAHIDGIGEADVNIPLSFTADNDSDVEGHSSRIRLREEDGHLEADVEGHVARWGREEESEEDNPAEDAEGHSGRWGREAESDDSEKQPDDDDDAEGHAAKAHV